MDNPPDRPSVFEAGRKKTDGRPDGITGEHMDSSNHLIFCTFIMNYFQLTFPLNLQLKTN